MKQVFRAHRLCKQDGPLGPYMDSYEAEMRSEGYAQQTREVQTRLVVGFCCWLGLLQAGVDRAVIALWLGHESVETTQIYLEANLAMKEEILAKTTPPGGKPGRYRPGDGLLTFLQNL